MTHQRLPHGLVLSAASTLFAIATLTGCASNEVAEIPLSATGETGRDIVRSNGCAACHGKNGEGGPGPTFVGLYGSTVEIKDGDTVIADDDYLYEAITDPKARIVEGFGFPMPENNLDDDQVESIIAFIRDLAATTEDAATTEESGP
jgi:cytochrome c oxidase subunit 2